MNEAYQATGWEIPGHWHWKGRIINAKTGKTVLACQHSHRGEATAKACADRMLRGHTASTLAKQKP